MTDDIKINKPPVWYTSVLVIAGLALFIAGFLTAKHFLQTIDSGAAYIFIVMFPLPIMLAGLYAIISALRQKIVVDKDKITFVDGLMSEEVIQREDVDAYVLRPNAGTLEVKRANKPDKEVFSIVAESDESLKEWLKPEKAVSEFLPDRPFNPSLYPKEYKPSVISKLLALIFIGSFIHAFWIFAPKQPYNYEFLAMLVSAFILVYFFYLRFMFGYNLVLHNNRIEVNVFPFKTVINRNEIAEFHFRIGGRNPGVLLKTKTNRLLIFKSKFIHTESTFTDDRDFLDWFNTLEAETDFPIPKLREEVK